ncbi:MAG: MBL fold metallo-hydrolase [Candidatus Burarchaeum sp.]|nr:MBL fold metallo-hydrolase [Candidatus Burarchaeum sp.]MDO8339466.1 MBL fold metallo-hydrolase [Candidatus Burarchaeum sp.]
MVSLTFYGGANEIGGNKILLEDKDARIYLDFGESFDFGTDYFYEYLKPRTANGLEVYFEFDMMPKVRRLYSRKMLEFTNLKYEKPDIDAIFISHSHSDHVNHLEFVDEDIPVYMGHGTQRIIEIYSKMYSSLFGIGEHNNMHLFKSGDKLKVKHLTVEPVHVEHSIPGAYGFIVRTSKGPLVYTGDLRMHGPKSAMTQEFIRKAAASKPHVLLCEGTRIGYESEHNYTEKEVEEKVTGIVAKSKGIVFANFSMSNVDRFMSFYSATVKSGRKLVVDTRFAYILDNLKDKIPGLPDVRTDPNILVYYRLSKSGAFVEKDYVPWEREFWSKKITYKELSANQKKYVMHITFYKLMELVYIRPEAADYIYSQSEHFLEGEENEAQKTVLENWMKHFNVEFHKAHCSGHASASELEELVRKIKPEILIPIHTKHPDKFRGLAEKIIEPVVGKEYEL